MKTLVISLLLVYSNIALAHECGAYLNSRLSSLVEEGKLTKKSNTTNKHSKLTDHDYPIKCYTSLNGIKYDIYTDEKKKCLIVKELKSESGEYFGVFCI